jgi:Trk K+ transport system NAD-binding subunit
MNDQIFWIVLKRLRIPFLVIIVTFAISIIGLILIGGVDDQGRPYHMSFFDAFYFVSYMATTIGFGEAPYTFTYPQRMWVSGIIYMTVIGWFYAIGSIVTLIQDDALRKALNRNRFRKQVRALGEPFYITLGYNEVIKEIINRISIDDYRFVVLDKDELKIDELMLENFYPHVPAIAADVTNQYMLKMAGIHRKNCVGIISLFKDDTKNTQIATICKLLNKKIDIIVKGSSPRHLEHFKSMGLKHVQDPFDIVSKRIYYSITAPHIWLLEMWAYGHSLNLRNRDQLPHGKYIVCGYGHMGKAIEKGLKKAEIEYVMYDLEAKAYEKKNGTTIFGDTKDREKLLELGVENADCIIAATKDDLLNLTLLNKAKKLNPNIFTIARENSIKELTMFQAAKINKIYVIEKILAESTYNCISKPLLDIFIFEVRKKDEEWAKIIVNMLSNITGMSPDYFEVEINLENAYALSLALEKGEEITLANIRRSRENRDEVLPIVFLLLKREEEIILVPDSQISLKLGDQLLIVSNDEYKEDFEYIINNLYELDYILGRD